MKLVRLTLQGIRGVPDRSYAFADSRTATPGDFVLVTGGTASGKTSLLEAVAAAKELVGGYGPPPDAARLVRRGEPKARIESTWLLSNAEKTRAGLADVEHSVVHEIGKGAARPAVDRALQQLFASYSPNPEHGKMEYFPAARRLVGPGSGPPAAVQPDALDARLRVRNDPEKYVSIRGFLRNLAMGDAARLARLVVERGVVLGRDRPDSLLPYKDAVSELLPDLRLAGVDIADDKAPVSFTRRDGAVVEMAELSSGEQQAVLFAVTFRRLGLNDSCILIDGPELHVHPEGHARFFGALVRLGTGNQIIAATTSSEILKTVPADHVIDLSKGWA
jgi:energy-coupling factor transporter ATP-binding protein EcfA2